MHVEQTSTRRSQRQAVDSERSYYENKLKEKQNHVFLMRVCVRLCDYYACASDAYAHPPTHTYIYVSACVNNEMMIEGQNGCGKRVSGGTENYVACSLSCLRAPLHTRGFSLSIEHRIKCRAAILRLFSDVETT